MDPTNTARARAHARDEALRLLERLTAGSAIAAFLGVGVFAVVSAQTVPGSAASTTTASTSTTSVATSNSSSTILPSSGISSSSGHAVVVTGGSR